MRRIRHTVCSTALLLLGAGCGATEENNAGPAPTEGSTIPSAVGTEAPAAVQPADPELPTAPGAGPSTGSTTPPIASTATSDSGGATDLGAIDLGTSDPLATDDSTSTAADAATATDASTAPATAGPSETAPPGASSGEPSAATLPPMPVAWVVEPTFTGNDNPSAPQVGVLRLQTDVPANVEVAVSGGDEEWTLTLPAAASFVQPIIGLKPDTSYSLSLSVNAGDNTLTAGPLTWATPPLPSGFPPIDVTISEPSEMEPGMTLFNARVGFSGKPALLVIVDNDGVVRWFYSDDSNPVQEDSSRLSNGNFLFHHSRCILMEIDPLGNTIHTWNAANYPQDCAVPDGSIPVPVQAFHHDLEQLPNGNFLGLSVEARTVDNFPTSDSNPDAPTSSTLVTTGVVIEFTPEGQLLKYIPMMDLLDPTRIGRGSLETQWPGTVIERGQTARDWDHTNAVVYDEASDSYIVSLRHQDAVIKVNRTTETLTWILGTPANWQAPWSDKLLTPVGDLQWPYHQHGVKPNPLGIGMYDNGNNRASAYEDVQPEYSRAVVFSIDEEAMSVRQVWSYGPESGADSFYSVAMGDADWQPVTGNVVMTSGQVEGPSGTYGQILEVTPDGRRVFELTLRNTGAAAGGTRPGMGAGGANNTYTMFRSERISDIRK